MIPFGAIAIVPEKHVMIVVVSLAEGDKRDPPTVTAAVAGPMGLSPPHMTDRVDTERRVEHEKRAPYTGQDKATEPTHPTAIEESHHKGQRKSGEENRQVIPILPHDEGVFPQRPFILLFAVGGLGE